MNHSRINIKRSKEKRKLFFEEFIGYKLFDKFFIIFMISILPFASFMNIYKNGISILSILFFLFGLATFLGLLYSVINTTKLRSIKGLDKNENRILLNNILERTNWIIRINNSDMLIAYQDYNWFSWDWGKELFIIFDKDEILINCISYGKHDLRSPFHWFVNRKRENKIIEEFKLVQKIATNG